MASNGHAELLHGVEMVRAQFQGTIRWEHTTPVRVTVQQRNQSVMNELEDAAKMILNKTPRGARDDKTASLTPCCPLPAAHLVFVMPAQLKEPRRALQPGQYSFPAVSPTMAPLIQAMGSTNNDDSSQGAPPPGGVSMEQH